MRMRPSFTNSINTNGCSHNEINFILLQSKIFSYTINNRVIIHSYHHQKKSEYHKKVSYAINKATLCIGTNKLTLGATKNKGSTKNRILWRGTRLQCLEGFPVTTFIEHRLQAMAAASGKFRKI